MSGLASAAAAKAEWRMKCSVTGGLVTSSGFGGPTGQCAAFRLCNTVLNLLDRGAAARL